MAYDLEKKTETIRLILSKCTSEVLFFEIRWEWKDEEEDVVGGVEIDVELASLILASEFLPFREAMEMAVKNRNAK